MESCTSGTTSTTAAAECSNVLTVVNDTSEVLADSSGDTSVLLGLSDDGSAHHVTEEGKYNYTSEHGETVFVTLVDPAISAQEISVGECSEPTDSILVTTTNEMTPYASKLSGDQSEKVDISQNWFTSRIDKKTLQEHGHKWKQGQWSADENEILRRNISQYCKGKSIEDPNEIIFEMSKDMRKDFYRVVARGLDRPLFSVYRRVLRMYDQKNHIGKYTPSELAKLKELRCQHGNDWATIGAALGRSAGSVRDRCRLMKDSCRYGTWQHEEEVRLASAVYELSGAQIGEEVHHGLCWADVAAKVATRTEKQCRAKWLNFLNWKQKGGAEWNSPSDDMLLVNKIIDLGVSNESDVDWVELAKDWSCVRSPQWLRSKWWTLKRHVPAYSTMPFCDLLNTLTIMQQHGVKHIFKNSSDTESTSAQSEDCLQQRIIPLRLAQLSSDGTAMSLLHHAVQLPDGSHALLSDEEMNLVQNMQVSTLPGGTYFITSAANPEEEDNGLNASLQNYPSTLVTSEQVVQTVKAESTLSTANGGSPSANNVSDEIILLEEDMDGNIQVSPSSADHSPGDVLIQLSPLADPILHSHTADLSSDV